MIRADLAVDLRTWLADKLVVLQAEAIRRGGADTCAASVDCPCLLCPDRPGQDFQS